MALKGSYRSGWEEVDNSGYIIATSDETGAMVINSPKGPKKPKKATKDSDIFKRYGYPSASYPELFEAVAYVQEAPIWVSSAIHADAKWGGVHITSGAVTAFSAGQVDPDNYVYSTNAQGYTETIGIGTGSGVLFSMTLANVPVDAYSLVLKVNGTKINAYESAGIITGSDISGSGTLDRTNGQISFSLAKAPAQGYAVTVEYSKSADVSTYVSHSFFAASPYEDDLAVKIENVSGQKFKLTLYQYFQGSYVYITEYNYSLLREKDGYGSNLYILDVFNDNDYLIAKVNSAYAYTTPSLVASTVALAGGKRGQTPTTADYSTSWNYFKYPNKYAAKNIMDVNGNNVTDINTILQTYQYYSHGYSVVPMGNDYSEAITYRQGLGLDTDMISLYTNWRKIYDPYNDSYAWISNIGSVGKKAAMMADVFDGMSFAGVDENGHGGQISDWRTVEMEFDYDDAMLAALDAAQINPIVQDPIYGVMIEGDKTLKVSASDTSFNFTRRIDNFIIEKVVKQVLKLKEFKLNNNNTRLQAKSMVETLLSPIIAKELIREARVICDESNNTDTVLTNRQFIIDIVKKSTTNNQKCILRLTRTAQNTVISEVIPV